MFLRRSQTRAAYHNALGEGADSKVALEMMARGGESDRGSTRELVARVGRSARLGERSRGVLDAGAASCALLLRAMADSMSELCGQRQLPTVPSRLPMWPAPQSAPGARNGDKLLSPLLENRVLRYNVLGPELISKKRIENSEL